jgi:hypothetical protein
VDLHGQFGDGESLHRRGEREDGGQGGADAGLVQVDPADAGCADLSRSGEPIEQVVADVGDIDAVEGGGEPVDHAGEPADDRREVVQHPPAAQLPGVVHDRFETQHVFAFGVGLQRQVRRSGP